MLVFIQDYKRITQAKLIGVCLCVSKSVIAFSIRSVTNHWSSCPILEPVAQSSTSRGMMSSSLRQSCTRRQSFCRSFFLDTTWWVAVLWLRHFKGHQLCPFLQDVILVLGVPRMCRWSFSPKFPTAGKCYFWGVSKISWFGVYANELHIPARLQKRPSCKGYVSLHCISTVINSC